MADETAGHLRAEALLAERKGLVVQLEETLRDNYEVAEYLRQQILTRDEQLAELQASLARVHTQPPQ